MNYLRIKEKHALNEIKEKFSSFEEVVKAARQPPQYLKENINRWKTE